MALSSAEYTPLELASDNYLISLESTLIELSISLSSTAPLKSSSSSGLSMKSVTLIAYAEINKAPNK